MLSLREGIEEPKKPVVPKIIEFHLCSRGCEWTEGFLSRIGLSSLRLWRESGYWTLVIYLIGLCNWMIKRGLCLAIKGFCVSRTWESA